MAYDLPTSHVNDQDLALGAAPKPMGLQWATVGWDGDTSPVDKGSASNDGTTFVKITTYAGRTPGEPPKPGVAQGHKYLAQLLGPVVRIPAIGDRVMVGFPTGMETTTGAAVILGTAGPVAGGTSQARILQNEDGSVNIYTRRGNASGGAGMMIQIDPSGAIRLVNDSGCGLVMDTTGIKLTTGGAALTMTISGNITLVGTGTTQIDGAGICIGSKPTMTLATNAALYGPTGPTAVPSLKTLIE